MAGRLPIIQPASAPLPDLAESLRGDGQAVHFVSLGCPKNRTDSEVMLGRLGQAGYRIADDARDADVIIVNSCTFIDAATTESVDTVLEMAELKREGRARRLVVSGCMAQRHHTSLRAELPEVDAFVGTGDYHRILEVVAEDRVAADVVGRPVYVQGAEPRVNTLTPWSAYLKILEGCPQRCTFCIIPKLRGDLMSRPLQVIVDEARALAATGVKELNLVGQDSNSWGRDLGRDERLPELLHALNDVEGISWIRLLYSYPAKFKAPLIDAFVGLDKVVPYIDMPLQHIADPILKAMRRGVSGGRTRALLRTLRSRIPDLAVRTGFIVGFPGETEEQFQELVSFVEEQQFENVGVFTFSPQEETPASGFPDQVPQQVRQERRERLMLLQQDIHLEKNTAWIDREVDVLVEGVHPETELLWVGRTRQQAPEIDGQVIINDAGSAAFGDIARVEITDVAGYDLVGHVVEDS